MNKKYYFVIPLTLQKIGYVFSWIIFHIFIPVEFRGTENLKNLKGPLILAANHTSELDCFVFPLLFPFFSNHFPLYFVSNQKDRYDLKSFGWRSFFYGGKLFNLLGAYEIHPGKNDYSYALQDHITLLQKGRTVIIFPEGRRTRDGNLSPAHGGVAYLASSTKASVVPIAINTLFGMNMKNFLMRKRRISVTVGQPVKPDQLVNESCSSDCKIESQILLNKIEELIKLK
jgi:1-acyl-sn-glycerol-3-phosphate acyltransferase